MLRRIPWAQGLGVGMLSLMLTVVVALPAQAVYPIEEPPGPPRNVVAVAGDGTAVVAWQVPDSTGSDYPIWSYRVTSVPPSSGCPLVLQPGPRSCEVTGLANGTSYIFFVSAGNIAGYGQAAASNPVTPQADKPVITISAVRSGGSVSVAGTTKNVPEGAVLSSWVRLEGESSFVQKGPATARADNAFAWRLEVPPDKGVEVYFTYEGVQSNVASAAADAQTSLAIGGSRNGNAVSISGLSVNVPMGSSITLLTRVNGLGDFAAVGTAVVGDDGRFSWAGTQAEGDQLDVVAEYAGLRSNILAFTGANRVTIVISGSRSANGRLVTIKGSTTKIPAGSSVQAIVTLDENPVRGMSVTVQSDGSFVWQRAVGANRTVAVAFLYADTTSNQVVLAPGEPTIGITGARDGKAMTISGLTSSMQEGTALTAYVREEGDVGFSPTTTATVTGDGSFTWTRALAPTRGAEVYFIGLGARSNTVFIPADASSLVITGTRKGTTVSITGLATGLQAGDGVTLRTRGFGENAYAEAGSATVGANGSFSFTTSVPLDQGVSAYVEGGGAESNTLVFNPLAPSIVLYRASVSEAQYPRISADGQAFNVGVGTVLVPFVSLDGGPFTTGVGVRTLTEEGSFAWSRLIAPGRGTVSVYFATVDGITSNTITLTR